MLQRSDQVHVLVVEDDADQRNLMATLLKHDGYDVITAEDAFHALTAVTAEELDIILLDLVMPVLEGGDVIPDVRRLNPRARIVVVSGLPDAKDRAIALGADAVVTKPLDIDALTATVAGLASQPRDVQAGITSAKEGA